MDQKIFVATKDDLENLINKAVAIAMNRINCITGKTEFDIMNVEQASEFLNLAIATIYDKTSKNLIPHKKKGNKLYFIRKELENWILDGNIKTSEEIDAEAMDYVMKKSSKKS